MLEEEAGFLAMSLMLDSCVERARPMLKGGMEMLGGTLESYGNITVSDSMYAINQLVFEDEALSMTDYIKCLDVDFDGHEELLEKVLDLPKFGNDIDEVDEFAERLNLHLCKLTRAQAKLVDLHHFLIVVINNSANITLGAHTGASADGRRDGQPVTNGHTPSTGRDKSGITALFNSILKLSCQYHAGAVHNIRFAKETLKKHYSEVVSLVDGYFSLGGAQCMITITSRDELEDAIANPQDYGHLLVRLGGYSARFVDLPKEIQQEVVARNAY
ncbi:MAG: hypothetical protein HQL32_03065 [Planctomycetes bacterium]|nr:hypothetical protein [Planctomycetota bacterium]